LLVERGQTIEQTPQLLAHRAFTHLVRSVPRSKPIEYHLPLRQNSQRALDQRDVPEKRSMPRRLFFLSLHKLRWIYDM
jgi:hypothetical protein